MVAPALTRRPVRAADRDFLLRLYTETRADLALLPLPEPALRQMVQMQFDAQAQGYAHRWPDADHEIIVLDGQDVGQLRLDRGPEALFCVDLSLLAARRGQGTGTRILQDMQAEAAARGQPVRFSVEQTNSGARALYERMGFAIDGDLVTHLTMVWHPAQGAAP